MVTDEKNIRQKVSKFAVSNKKTEKDEDIETKSKAGGIVTGTATVLGGQAAAMGIATTFGTASTERQLVH